MTDASLRLVVADGIATITLTRASAGNAMNMAFMDELYDAASAVADDKAVRTILLESEGRNFCVGGDLKELGQEDHDGRHMRMLAGRLHEGLKLLVAQRAPIVVAVQGAAAGAGLSLVALADIAIAARSASFVMAYAGIGLTADGGATWLLPRVIGLKRTQEMAFTSRRLSAEEAEKYGLVTRVVEGAALAEQARATAAKIAAGPTAAFGAVRRLLSAQSGAALVDHLDAELDAITIARASDEANEGIAAFLERRAPLFVGR